MNVPALYLCFFLSGASALVYQVVWERMLTLVFGLSTLSVAAVLSAFLGGMALGARLFGPPADRSKRPARLYALIELAIALAGLATLAYIPALMQGFKAAYAALEPGMVGSNLIRFVLAFVAIGLPCIFIGGTAPTMARLLALRFGSTALGFGRGYAINTAGSVFGALLAGFVLIRFIGMQNALFVAVAGNTAAFLIAVRLGAGVSSPASSSEMASDTSHAGSGAEPDGARTIQVRLAMLVAALTGGIALAYEVAWIRLLAIFTLNSVYVFTMVVSVYLAALALGAALTTRLLRKARADEWSVLSVCQLVLALLTPPLVVLAPLASRLELRAGVLSEAAVFGTEYLLVAAVVFVPTLLIGAGLPLLVSMASRSAGDAGRTVGRVYAWNAVGTIAGAALTGAVLIPAIGLRGCLLLLAGLNLLIVAIAFYATRRTASWSRGLAPAGAAAFAILVALTPATARFYVPEDAPGERIIYYAEGPSATVHVAEYGGDERWHRTLFVDSKSVAGTYDEIVTDQKMLAHLPLLLHPNPQRALTVGFGTGGTSYSMLQHNITVNCVEIEPRVPDAYRFFESENGGQVGPDHDRLNFRLILDDARAWLHVAPEKYDVIVTDLTSIQYRGNGNLYTAECFRLMQQQLNPGGIGAAWVPITGITPRALRVLVRTFEIVFPHTSVWYAINLPTDFVILVGTESRLAIRLDDVAERMKPTLVQRDLARIGMDNPYKLAACLLLAEEMVDHYVGNGPVHRDDRPVLDYMTHATPYHNTLATNLEHLTAMRSDVADYIACWPPSDGADAPQRLAAWIKASEHLIHGHIALRRPGTDADRSDARAAYKAALELVPDDERTRALVEALTLKN